MDYKEYIQSDCWKQYSKDLREAIGMCECCEATKSLQVHHLSYAHMSEEGHLECAVLCKSCHKAIHDEIKRRTALLLEDVSLEFLLNRPENPEYVMPINRFQHELTQEK